MKKGEGRIGKEGDGERRKGVREEGSCKGRRRREQRGEEWEGKNGEA